MHRHSERIRKLLYTTWLGCPLWVPSAPGEPPSNLLPHHIMVQPPPGQLIPWASCCHLCHWCSEWCLGHRTWSVDMSWSVGNIISSKPTWQCNPIVITESTIVYLNQTQPWRGCCPELLMWINSNLLDGLVHFSSLTWLWRQSKINRSTLGRFVWTEARRDNFSCFDAHWNVTLISFQKVRMTSYLLETVLFMISKEFVRIFLPKWENSFFMIIQLLGEKSIPWLVFILKLKGKNRL